MIIGVLGATGALGTQFVRQALDAGHTVVAVARRPDALVGHGNLKAIAASIDDFAALTTAFSGCEVVVSMLGSTTFRMGSRAPVDFMQKYLPGIVKAVNAAEVRRFILTSAFGVGDSAQKGSIVARLAFRTLVKPLFDDKSMAERSLEGGGVPITIVYPVNLKAAPSSGVAAAVQPLEAVTSVPGLPALPIADAAAAILAIALDPHSAAKRLLITTPKGWRGKFR